MGKRSTSDLTALVLALLVTTGLLGGIAWWVWEIMPKSGWGNPQPPDSAFNQKAVLTSAGDRSIFATLPTVDQQAGYQAIARQDYASAATAFQRSLDKRRNDPETRIFLNNASVEATKSADQRSAKPLKIGVVVPSSASPKTALEILRGVAQAQTEINRRSDLNSPKLLIRLADDGNDPDRGIAVARVLSQDPELMAIVGPQTSPVALAVVPVYADQKLTVISPTSTAVKLSGGSPYFFRTAPSDAIAGRTLGDYALKQFPNPKVAIFYNSNSAYSTSLQTEFKTTLVAGGGQPIAEFDIQAPDFSVAKSIASAQTQGATVLALALGTPDLARSLQVISQNQGQLPIVAGDALYNPETLEVPNCQAQTLILGVPWNLDTFATTPFATGAWTLWGAAVNWRSAMAYDAVQTIATGVSQLSAQQPNQPVSREALRNAIATSGFVAPGAVGEVRFMPSGDRLTAIQLLKVAPAATTPQQCRFKPL